MTKNAIVTDYLVVGAGAAEMAFADSLITDSDADMVMVDRRHPMTRARLASWDFAWEW